MTICGPPASAANLPRSTSSPSTSRHKRSRRKKTTIFAPYFFPSPFDGAKCIFQNPAKQALFGPFASVGVNGHTTYTTGFHRAAPQRHRASGGGRGGMDRWVFKNLEAMVPLPPLLRSCHAIATYPAVRVGGGKEGDVLSGHKKKKNKNKPCPNTGEYPRYPKAKR